MPLRAPWAHVALLGTLLALLLFLAPKVWRHSQAQRLFANPNIENMRRAIALEPDRAEYRDALGRDYLFSLATYDPQAALESLQRATQLNPSVADYWMDLATAYDSLGLKKESVECVETARRHDPLNPRIAWSMGNIRAEAGDIPAALEAWRVALREEPGQSGEAFDLGWRVAPDTKMLLDHLVPTDDESDLAFLDFLLSHPGGEPQLAWNRVIARGHAFAPALAAGYFEYLLVRSPPAERRKNVETAKRTWIQLKHMLASANALPAADGENEEPRPNPTADGNDALSNDAGNQIGNLINNGGFESALLNMGFDWTWDQPKGATLVLDQTMSKGGRQSARIDFDGTESLIFAGLQQLVPVEPGHRYRLTCYVRAESITGGAGIRMEIAAPHMDVHVPPLAHGQEVFQTADWVADNINFLAPPNTYLVSIQVRRDLRGPHTSKLSGRFWLDRVAMHEVSSFETPSDLPSDSPLRRGRP